MARRHAAQIGQGHGEDLTGLLDRMADRLERAESYELDVAAIAAGDDAEIAEPALTARRRPRAPRRRRHQLHVGIAALDLEMDRLAGAQHHHLLQVGEVVDGLAVGLEDQVARAEARRSRRRGRGDLADPRLDLHVAHDQRQGGEDDDGEDEVRRRTGRDHQGPLPQRLEMEVAAQPLGAFFRQHLLPEFGEVLGVRNAGRVLVAGEADVAPHGDPAETPLHAGLVSPRQKRLAKADGEAVAGHAAQTRHGQVAELMDGDDKRQHRQERQDIDRDSQHDGKHWAVSSPPI